MSEDTPSQAQELLSRLGQRLKAEREARGLTTQEIASQTRINPAFIRKIEAGELEGLPGLTFVRGFIRNYLQVLQLKDEDIEMELGRFAGLEQYRSETTLESKITRMHHEGGAALPFQKIVIGGLAALLVIWGAYMLYRVFSGSGADEPAQVTVEEKAPEATEDGIRKDESETAATETAGEAGPAKRDAPPGSPQAEEAPPAVAATQAESNRPLEAPQNLRLTIRGLEPTWLRVSVDRAPPFEVLVEPAETLNWDANEEIRLVIGKSQGVAVYLNGEDILLPSERDQLIPDVVLNKLTLLRLEN